MFWLYPPSRSKLRIPIFRRLVHRKTRISLPGSEPVSVFNSVYHDPFLNLAYENWMYENVDFEKRDVLLFWRNSPCVVIGRHQNPWLECNVRFLDKLGVKLARRYSGGGTVYHDLGNLNITFLTNRARYNRRRNLESITKALCETWDLDVCISPRDDLLVDGIYKVSGSAAKLGKHSSYHHCTLLCETDLDKLHKAITSSNLVATSRSMQSISSQVANLKDIEPSISFDKIINGVVKAYCQSSQNPQLLPLGFFDQYQADVNKFKSELQNWEWIYGKTAPFTLTNSILLSSGTKTTVTLEIIAGLIKNLTVSPNAISVSHETFLKEFLIGTRFVSKDISLVIDREVQSWLNLKINDTIKKDIQEILSSILDKSRCSGA